MCLLGHRGGPVEGQAETAILAEGVTAAAVVPAGPPTLPAPALAGAAVTPPATRVETMPAAVPARTERRRRAWLPALAGAAGALVLAGGVVTSLVAFRDHAHGRHVQTGPSAGVSAPLVGGASTPPSSPTGRPSSPSSSASVRPAPRPHLDIEVAGCDLGAAGLTCTVTLTGSGAPFHWTATATDPLSLSASSGSLNPGESVTVTITLHPSSPRTGGSGTATLIGAGRVRTVTVTWEGEPTPDPSST
jgi:hypothetical protein